MKKEDMVPVGKSGKFKKEGGQGKGAISEMSRRITNQSIAS